MSPHINVPWYCQSFGNLYPLVYAHRNSIAADNEIRALSEWISLDPSRLILDACCGNGRHLKVLLNLGCRAVGFDLSGELIAQASADEQLKGRICRADIRQIPYQDSFDCVLNLFTSFGYFSDESDNRKTMAELAGCLRPGGELVLDHMNAARVRYTLVPESECFTRGLRVYQQRWIRSGRVQKRIEISNSIGEQQIFREDVRLYEPEEMIEMARSAGMGDVSLHGSFSGAPFNADSERMILRARRPSR